MFEWLRNIFEGCRETKSNHRELPPTPKRPPTPQPKSPLPSVDAEIRKLRIDRLTNNLPCTQITIGWAKYNLLLSQLAEHSNLFYLGFAQESPKIYGMAISIDYDQSDRLEIF